MSSVVKYRIGYDSENIPFTFFSNGVGCGAELDYLRAVCEVADLDCQFFPMKWSKLFHSLDVGEVHAIFSSISRTSQRSLLYNFTMPYFDSPEAIVYKGRLESFSAVRSIGVLAGTNHLTYAMSELNTLQLFEFSDLNALAEGIQDESVDSLLVGVDTAGLFISKFLALDLKLHDELIIAPKYFGEGSSVVVQKNELVLLDSLNFGISKLGGLSF
ncbi:ABC transporter arginine-binding protein 1 precursor [compost metagenome]